MLRYAEDEGIDHPRPASGYDMPLSLIDNPRGGSSEFMCDGGFAIKRRIR